MSTGQLSSSIVEVISTELSVAYVKYGGNAADGAYFFAFSKQHIYIPHRSTFPHKIDCVTMRFHLGKHVPDNFVITGLVSTYSFGNLSPESIHYLASERHREIETKNNVTQAGFFRIGILVTDTNINPNTGTETVIFCDPQVVNGPGEGDNG